MCIGGELHNDVCFILEKKNAFWLHCILVFWVYCGLKKNLTINISASSSVDFSVWLLTVGAIWQLLDAERLTPKPDVYSWCFGFLKHFFFFPTNLHCSGWKWTHCDVTLSMYLQGNKRQQNRIRDGILGWIFASTFDGFDLTDLEAGKLKQTPTLAKYKHKWAFTLNT